jgi:hypothetical protein
MGVFIPAKKIPITDFEITYSLQFSIHFPKITNPSHFLPILPNFIEKTLVLADGSVVKSHALFEADEPYASEYIKERIAVPGGGSPVPEEERVRPGRPSGKKMML